MFLAVPAFGQTYYVDPDFTGGTRTGSASQPWQSLQDSVSPTPWTTLNAALASAPATVYFSARAAGSDVDETSTTQIQLNRTDTSANRLTLNGNAFYNTDDTTPSWVSYSGSSQFHITSSTPVDSNNRSAPFTSRSYITVTGFQLTSTINQVVFLFSSQNIIITNNIIEHDVGSSIGPAVITGQSDATAALPSDITIGPSNIIRNTYGECVYIGNTAAGEVVPGVEGASGANITITGNTIYDCGLQGGQGDAIDVKAGHTNLTISQNTIYQDTLITTSSPVGIVVESCSLIERNFIHDMPTKGVRLVGGYYNVTIGRDGCVLRNNVIVQNVSGNNALDLNGATMGDATWTNTGVYNNVIYTTQTTTPVAALNQTTGIIFTNNIILSSVAVVLANFATGTLGTHDYNVYRRPSGAGTLVTGGATNYTAATLTTFEANSISTDPVLVDTTTTPYVATNFALQTSSPAKDTGTTIASFSNDYLNNARPFNTVWDRGAFEFGASVGTTGASLRVR